MTRLCCAVLCAVLPTGAMGLPPRPDPRPEAYTKPLDVFTAMGLPLGIRTTVPDLTRRAKRPEAFGVGPLLILDAEAADRLKLFVGSAERWSDARARSSWRNGWNDAADVYSPLMTSAEAAAAVASARAVAESRRADSLLLIAQETPSAWGFLGDLAGAAGWVALGLGGGWLAWGGR